MLVNEYKAVFRFKKRKMRKRKYLASYFDKVWGRLFFLELGKHACVNDVIQMEFCLQQSFFIYSMSKQHSINLSVAEHKAR